MTRNLLLAVATLATLTPPAFAQEPQRTKELKDADRFIATAMISQDSVDRRAKLERALNPLQQAMAKNPDNALVWLTAGQVYAKLQQFARADSAFDRAQALYPAYASDIEAERVQAWIDALNLSVKLTDAQKIPEAVAALEAAELIYDQRPESKLNLGLLYSNNRDYARAEQQYRALLDLVKTAPSRNLKPEDAAEWVKMEKLAAINLAQLVNERGVAAFGKQDWATAAADFREAAALNPYARDYVYNLAEALYSAGLADEDKARTAKGPERRELEKKVIATYETIEPFLARARSFDPSNRRMFMLLARGYNLRGAATTDVAKKAEFRKLGDELLKSHGTLTAEIASVFAVMIGGGQATIRGELQNITLKPGEPVQIHFTLLGLDGTTVGEQDIAVTAPAVGQTAPFEATTKITGEVAGWKYEIAK